MRLRLGEWTDGLNNGLTLRRWHHTKAVITPTRWRCRTPRSSVTACRRFALLSDGWRWRPRHPPGIVTRARSGSLFELPRGGLTSPNRHLGSLCNRREQLRRRRIRCVHYRCDSPATSVNDEHQNVADGNLLEGCRWFDCPNCDVRGFPFIRFRLGSARWLLA